ncbi:MAG: hypothetical protein PHI44_04185 [Candidatus Ratteibacteria bacterium]|nr:hypothetical protein [Candidatus Ratteibacteria bacterium]
MDQKVIDEGKGLAWLSYLGVLLVVPLLVNKDNEYSKFHVKQGIVLLICSIGWQIVSMIFNMIPVIGTIIYAVGILFLFILMVIGIINALSGKTEPLPVMGKYAEKINI